MAWDLNSVVLIGRLTKDPQVRYTASGLAVCSISLAVGGRKKEGNPDDEVSFFDVVSFGKIAEICNQYLNKGKQAAVHGYLRQNRWEDQNGQKRYKVEVVADKIQFLGGSSNVSQESGVSSSSEKVMDQGNPENVNEPFSDDDDIPF